MGRDAIDLLHERVRRLEDESAITQLIMAYGPAADARLASFAGQLWLEDGTYDWDGAGRPFQGSSGIEAMLSSEAHQGLVAQGVAHFAGPLLVDIEDDVATAFNYSLIMRHEESRYSLWRVSAVRWDLERAGSTWRVRKRTNRLLDPSGAGSKLFGEGIREVFGEVPR